ncbi:uncharacterized protein G2W53_017884 [Senna tora]|uniref:Uncharacterized protein n=1 Tax=Senna tora TaxID=362788 RepID=A0A834TUY1_9FABA|nr:uncharacterized protein G2W53_017884 [Senna tora]
MVGSHLGKVHHVMVRQASHHVMVRQASHHAMA